MAVVARWDAVALPEPPVRPTRRVRWVQTCAAHGAALALFTLLTVCRAWPIVLHPASTVTPDLIDPVHHIWSATASIHYATTLPQGLWSFFDANIFYPTPHAAAYADEFVGLLPLSLPLHLLIHNPVVLINVLGAAAFILSAYGAFLLGREVTGSYWAAVFAGLVFGFCPLRDQQIGHVTLISTEWQVAAALCLACCGCPGCQHNRSPGRGRSAIRRTATASNRFASAPGRDDEIDGESSARRARGLLERQYGNLIYCGG